MDYVSHEHIYGLVYGWTTLPISPFSWLWLPGLSPKGQDKRAWGGAQVLGSTNVWECGWKWPSRLQAGAEDCSRWFLKVPGFQTEDQGHVIYTHTHDSHIRRRLLLSWLAVNWNELIINEDYWNKYVHYKIGWDSQFHYTALAVGWSL